MADANPETVSFTPASMILSMLVVNNFPQAVPRSMLSTKKRLIDWHSKGKHTPVEVVDTGFCKHGIVFHLGFSHRGAVVGNDDQLCLSL